MVYITAGQANEFSLNVNNNYRDWSAVNSNLSVEVTHSLSNNLYELNCGVITPTNPNPDPSFYAAYNPRYMEFYIDTDKTSYLFPWDGQYYVQIKCATKGGGEAVVYNGIFMVSGNSIIDDNPFIEYRSDNDINESVIYIE